MIHLIRKWLWSKYFFFLVESLEVEEVELRKEIAIARKAMFENLSNPSKKEKKCAVNLDKQNLQIDAMKMK